MTRPATDRPAADGAEDQQRLLSARQLADYLQIPLATLYQWRYRGEGPPGFKLGNHVRYRWTDIQTWLDTHADPRC